MKNDRFLISILIGIVLIIFLALGLYFQRQAMPSYKGGSNPDDIVHDYALALAQGDYEKAYGYLAEGKLKPDFDTFRARLPHQRAQCFQFQPENRPGKDRKGRGARSSDSPAGWGRPFRRYHEDGIHWNFDQTRRGMEDQRSALPVHELELD